MTHHDQTTTCGGGALSAPDLEARVAQLEHQVERLTKALALMGIAAEFASAPSTPDTSAPAPVDRRLTELRPA